jgi:hypothetical protein
VTWNFSSQGAPHETLADKIARQDRLEENQKMGRPRDFGAAPNRVDVPDWAKQLDPSEKGAWVLRFSSDDGTWVLFTSTKGIIRSGNLITIWIRWEQSTRQRSMSGPGFMSFVERVQFDCKNLRARTLKLTTYGERNLSGISQSIEVDPGVATWKSVIPGTQGESNLNLACTDSD